MNSIAHISSPSSESWVYWILLLFFILVVVNQYVRDSVIVAVRSSFSHSERIYGGQSQHIMTLITSWVFRIGISALLIYFLLATSCGFQFLTYLKVFGVITLVAILRQLLVVVVGWVFLSPNQFANGMSQIDPIRNLCCVLLLPIVLLLIHLHNPIISFILLGIVLLGFTVFVIAKALLLYYKGLLSIFYILLYFTCLEIIPVMGMLLWTQHILQ